MTSQQHDSFLALFRDQPRLVYALLRDLLQQQIPMPTSVLLTASGASPISPKYRADLVLEGVGAPTVLVEVLLHPDEEKQQRWPLCIASIASRREDGRGVVLVVVTPSRETAAWAATPIQTGHPGFTLTPLVLSPDNIPVVTDADVAARSPGLAVLSAITHGCGPDAVRVGQTAFDAVAKLGDPQARFYGDLVLSVLSRAAQDELEESSMLS